VRGIVHLVSSSVEGLEAERVTVVDTAGRMLTQVADRPGAGQHLERQGMLEQELQRRVQSMLEEVLGPGKASVRVAAQVEFSHGERTEERVDPNGVVKSEQRSTETTKGSSTRPGGVVGSAANTGNPAVGGSGTSSNNETVKEQESVQYEVGRVVERRTLVAGEIKRLSVAVLVDPPYKVTPAAGGPEQRTPLPRPKAELEKLRAMVMRAVGYTAARGDEVEVAEMVFDTSAVERERVTAERTEQHAFWWGTAQQAGWVGGLLLLGFLALRALRGLLGRRPAVGTRLDITDAAVAATAAAGQLSSTATPALNPADLVKAREREVLHEQITELARSNPDQVAQLVRSWMLRKRAS
jgi:flagellar M-ring protein FliF